MQYDAAAVAAYFDEFGVREWDRLEQSIATPRSRHTSPARAELLIPMAAVSTGPFPISPPVRHTLRRDMRWPRQTVATATRPVAGSSASTSACPGCCEPLSPPITRISPFSTTEVVPARSVGRLDAAGRVVHSPVAKS